MKSSEVASAEQHQDSPTSTLIAKGIHAVEEAIDSGRPIDRIWMRTGLQNPRLSQLRRKAQQANIPIAYVPQQKLRQWGKAHQGVVALLSPVHFVSWQEIVQHAYESGEHPLLLVCDRITDVRNFGAILRTAWIAGVHGVLIPQRHTAALNAEVVKASAGALLHVSLCREANLKKALGQLKNQGLLIAAAEAAHGIPPDQAPLNQPLALIVGSEGSGVHPQLLQLADLRLTIPMRRPLNSYNVSAATAMLLYEVMRQRGQTLM
ncbi:MAG: 23S rRNA (guanosine(2251)-2'-O)-methyltransferase RlmB [Chitinophagales bacterium]|nr:23S rRNA (guanosine(2251)-2'-O)-methyltransferase RlmB [Chitinophagales bacterium]MDW8427471.1 23S rRNA (guanosine(2251)-2'-O)-methyltransferase RlmB [Chitinophagales bacterium]